MGDQVDEALNLENYTLEKLLGSGTFGEAYLAKDKRNGRLVAIKYMLRSSFSPYVSREILIHKQLQHSSVARFIEVVLTDDYLAIVMEAADQGDLFEYVFEKQGLEEDEAKWIFYQLMLGLRHMHKQGVAHRDIKLENILLSGDGAKPKVKLCDFGYSKRVGLDSICKTVAGTFTYVAPEVIENDHHNYEGSGVDVWAAGVTLYAMTLMSYPFEDPKDPMNNVKTAERILNVQYKIPPNYPPDLSKILRGIFVPEPAERTTAELLVKKMKAWYPEEALNEEAEQESLALQSDEELRRILNMVVRNEDEGSLTDDLNELEVDAEDDAPEKFLSYKHGPAFTETLRSIRDIRGGEM